MPGDPLVWFTAGIVVGIFFREIMEYLETRYELLIQIRRRK